MSRPVTAMVLCAGLGLRMRPLTEDRPKPLVEVGGKPMIDWILDGLADGGIERIVINLHYLPEMLRDHLTGRTRPEVLFADESERLLGSGGGVVNALPLIGEDLFFILNGDALWGSGFKAVTDALADAWNPATDDVVATLVPLERTHGFDGDGDFFLSGSGHLTRRGDHPAAPYVYASAQLVHRRLFEGCKPEPFSFNELWDKAIAADRMRGIVHDDDWYHVGTPSAVAPTSAALSGQP